jgi:hypothetical protein
MYFSSGEYPQRGVPHETLLEQVQIPSLASSRKLASIKFLSDVFNCSVDCPYLLSQFSIRIPSFSCRKHNTFYLDTARTNLFVEVWNVFSMLSIDKALSLDCPIVLCKNVFTRFKVEKHLSLSTVVMGSVHKIFNNFTDSENVSDKFILIKS